MSIWLRRLLAALVAFALIASSCGDDDDDAPSDESSEEGSDDAVGGDDDPADGDGSDGDDVDEEVDEEVDEGDDTGGPLPDGWVVQPAELATARVNPSACVIGDVADPADGFDELVDFEGLTDLTNVGPIDITAPPMPPAPVYVGPMYRPGLLLAPAGYDPPLGLEQQVRLAEVELDGVNGPTIDGEGFGGLEAEAELLDGVVSVWWIAGAESEALLDPANVARAFAGEGLEPVYLLVPAAGHMYGPENTPAVEGAEEDRVGGSKWGYADVVGDPVVPGPVGIIDTSFDQLPDLNAPADSHSVQGHGSFIAGIVRELAPGAPIKSVDMGPAGEDLTVVLDKAIEDLPDAAVYGSAATGFPFDGDWLQLLITLAALTGLEPVGSDPPLAALNMSFGTYLCAPDQEPGVGPPGLQELIDQIGVEVFAAAGNDDSDDAWYPAAYNQQASPWAVGALQGDGTWATFSNHGSWVETCELGEPVTAEPYLPGSGSQNHITWSGTSFAAPIALARYLTTGDPTPQDCPATP